MFTKKMRTQVPILVLLVVMVASVSAFAGSAVIGSVAGSMNATMGGQALIPNTTVFSGDSLQVKDGAAVVAVGQGSRLVFGRETVASFLREADEVTVLLSQGNVSLYHAGEPAGLRVKVGEISVVPAAGYKTLGDVAMLNGAVVVTAKEGLLRVEGSGPAVEVAKGKTITVRSKAARSPQGAGSGAAGVSTSTALQLGSIATSATAAVLSGTAVARASDAQDAASSAGSTAASAETAAQDAMSAAQDAVAAAEAAEATAFAAGCALDAAVFPDLGISPFQEATGRSCFE